MAFINERTLKNKSVLRKALNSTTVISYKSFTIQNYIKYTENASTREFWMTLFVHARTAIKMSGYTIKEGEHNVFPNPYLVPAKAFATFFTLADHIPIGLLTPIYIHSKTFTA